MSQRDGGEDLGQGSWASLVTTSRGSSFSVRIEIGCRGAVRVDSVVEHTGCSFRQRM